MINDDFKKKVEKLKEDLIYAMNEEYEGELEIEDVTNSSYYKMFLEQDKNFIEKSSLFYAEAASKIIETITEYLDELNEFNRRTIFRNSEIVEDTLNDLYKAAEILILSIRKNNADWQVRLDSFLKNKTNNIEFNLFNIFNNIQENKGDED